MNARRHLHDPFENELCLIGAASDDALPNEVQKLARALERSPDLPLRDVAFTLAHAARNAPAVVAIVADSTTDLRERLTIVHARLSARTTRIRDKAGTYYFRERLRTERGVAFLFPGELSLHPGMLRDICLAFDFCREAFDEADAACEADGFRPGDWLFGSATARAGADDVEPAPGMAGSLLCTHAANTAMSRLFLAIGMRPDAVLGYSGGELAALEFAGVFGPLKAADRIRFLRDGYRFCSGLTIHPDVPPGVLLSIEDPEPDLLDALATHCKKAAAPVMLDSSRHMIISVPQDIAEECEQWLRHRSVRVVSLGVRRFYHTPASTPHMANIRSFFRRWARHAPQLPVYTCLDSTLLPSRPSQLQEACTRQWFEPVRFGGTIEKLHDAGFRIFVELGARGQLSTHINEVLNNRPHLAVATDRVHRPGLTQLHHALAQLAAHGVAFDATALHMHRGSALLNLSHPASQKHPTADATVRLNSALPEIGAFDPTSPLYVAEADPAAATANTGKLQRANFGADFPLLAGATILSEKTGESLEISQDFTTDAFPFLRDYAPASHEVSLSNPRLGGLSMISAIACIEIMAEAARGLAPTKRVVQVDDLRGKRMVPFERGAARIVIQATRIEWPDDPGTTAVHVTLRTPTADSRFSIPMAEATVFLAAQPPEREMARPAPLQNPRAVGWTGEEIYPDRLFHGPLLQTVNIVRQWAEDGLDYEIRVPSRAGAVRHTLIPFFSIWPIAMEGLISGVSLWRGAEKFNGVLTLPFRARTIRMLATVVPPEGARLQAYLRITARNPHSYVADLQVADARGRLVMSATGWEELICNITPPIHRMMLRPADNFLSHEMPPEHFGDAAVATRGSLLTDIPYPALEGQQELWLKALACAVLNQAERDEWLAMRGIATRRIEWLLGRACVKEALRRHLLEKHQQRWASADIAIWTDDSGKPHAHGPWMNHIRQETVDISIAHTPGMIAAAIAVNGRIGIDIERVGRDLSEDFTESVFTAEEHDLAARSGEGPLTMLRFWCGKEALAKALGTGLRYNPSDLRVRAVDAATGRLDLELAGQWLDAFRTLRGRAMPVHTALADDHLLATCVIPAALLPPP